MSLMIQGHWGRRWLLSEKWLRVKFMTTYWMDDAVFFIVISVLSLSKVPKVGASASRIRVCARFCIPWLLLVGFFVTRRLLLKTTLAVMNYRMAHLGKCHCIALKTWWERIVTGFGEIWTEYLLPDTWKLVALLIFLWFFLLNKLNIKNPFEISCKFFHLSPTELAFTHRGEKKKKARPYLAIFNVKCHLHFCYFPFYFSCYETCLPI